VSLTHKQESFAQAVASGMSQSDAYRATGDVSEDTKPESIWERASLIASDIKVQSRIAQLKDEIAAKALWTREDSVRTLKDIATDEAARHGDKTGAVKVLNEMHGYNAPKEINVNGNLGINVHFD
jgi:phage terminase small subunit